MRSGYQGSSQRTHSFANAAALADGDALKASIATDNAAAHTYSGTALDGALANPGPAVFDPPRFVSVTTSAEAACYRTGASYPIVFTGMRGGETVTESLLLTQAGGNETIIGNQPFDRVTSIAVPIQLKATGAFTFGVHGVACKATAKTQLPFRQVRAVGAGSLKVGFAGGTTDTLTLADAEKDAIEVVRVYGASATTCGVRIYE